MCVCVSLGAYIKVCDQTEFAEVQSWIMSVKQDLRFLDFDHLIRPLKCICLST